MTPAAEWAVRYRLATVLAVVIGLIVAIGAVLLWIGRDLPTPEVWGFRGFTGLVSVAYGVVGWLIGSRRPRNPIGWVFLGGALAGALQFLISEYAVAAVNSTPWLPMAQLAWWTLSWIWTIPAFAVSLLLFLLFRTGDCPRRGGGSSWSEGSGP